jgi:hypothetical protein
LLYELSGLGSLFKGDEKLLDISYDLKFFQEVIITGGEERITGLTDFAGALLSPLSATRETFTSVEKSTNVMVPHDFLWNLHGLKNTFRTRIYEDSIPRLF